MAQKPASGSSAIKNDDNEEKKNADNANAAHPQRPSSAPPSLRQGSPPPQGAVQARPGSAPPTGRTIVSIERTSIAELLWALDHKGICIYPFTLFYLYVHVFYIFLAFALLTNILSLLSIFRRTSCKTCTPNSCVGRSPQKEQRQRYR